MWTCIWPNDYEQFVLLFILQFQNIKVLEERN